MATVLAPERTRWHPVTAELGRVVRFGCVGALGVGVNSALLWLLTEHAGLYYLLSSLLATEAATLFNFTLNHLWTFSGTRDREPVLRKLAKYNVVSIGSLLLTVGSLWLWTELLHLHYLAANVVAIGSVPSSGAGSGEVAGWDSGRPAGFSGDGAAERCWASASMRLASRRANSSSRRW